MYKKKEFEAAKHEASDKNEIEKYFFLMIIKCS